MRPYSGFESGELPAEETSIASQPASLSRRASSTDSSAVVPLPSGIQSVAEMRTDIGRSSGQAARIARKTSSG